MPILYPLSFLWIYVYTVASTKFDTTNIGKITSMILVSSGLGFLVGTLLLFYFYGIFSLDYRADSIGFIDYMFSTPRGPESIFYLASLIFSCILASIIKLNQNKRKSDFPEDIIDTEIK